MILTPQIASLYGALDSVAFAKGAAFSAHLLRVIAMNRNRLVAKGQHLCCLLWPTHDTTESAGDVFSGFGPLTHQRVHPPIPVKVKPGLTTADIRMTMRTAAGHIVSVQIVTRGRPLNRNAGSSVNTRVGPATGWTDVDIDGVPLNPDRGGNEQFEIWVRGLPTTTLGTLSGNVYGTADAARGNLVADIGASWTPTGLGGSSWAEGGHQIAFLDAAYLSGGNELLRRDIVVVPGPENLTIAPALTPVEERLIASVGAYYVIYQSARWSIANFSAAARPRTS